MATETVSSARRVWLYLDDGDAPPIDVGRFFSDAGWLAGTVCGKVPPTASGGAGLVIVRAHSQLELSDLLGAHGQVFVPSVLVDSVGLLTARLREFRGCLWLEDTYTSRYTLDHYLRPCAQLAAFGLVGTGPGARWHESGVRYAFRYSAGTPTNALVAALAAGVCDIWLSVTRSADLRGCLRRITDAAHSAELVTLFGGASAADLSRGWEQRLSLAAGRTLDVGHELTDNDLLCVPGGGGLSVDLRPRIVGRRLRYSLAAYAPLTFGVLEC